MSEFLDRLDSAEPPDASDSRMLAALGPAMWGLARDRSAGAHTFLATVGHTRAARDILGPDKRLVPEVTVVLETGAVRAREIARAGIAYNLQLPNYVNHWRRAGLTDEDLAGSGSDRLVDALVASGDEDAVLTRVREHLHAGADEVAIQVITGAGAGAPELPITQWRRVAPALASL